MSSGPEGFGAPPTPRRRAVRLQTSRDARAFLGKIINGVYRDEMSPGKASRIGYLLGIFLRSIEIEELAQREAEKEVKQVLPEEVAARLRRAMREASDLVPGPPGESDGT